MVLSADEVLLSNKTPKCVQLVSFSRLCDTFFSQLDGLNQFIKKKNAEYIDPKSTKWFKKHHDLIFQLSTPTGPNWIGLSLNLARAARTPQLKIRLPEKLA